MITYTIALYLLILIIGIPFGLILAKICKEEIRAWKTRLIAFTLISLALSISIYLATNLTLKEPISVALLFIVITFGTIIVLEGRHR